MASRGYPFGVRFLSGRLKLAAFYVRRTCRIFPLYYLVLGLYAAAMLGLKLRPAQAGLRHEPGQPDELRAADQKRQAEWDTDGKADLAYRGNELAGEVGEACNVIKKIERERRGLRGSRATVVASRPHHTGRCRVQPP